MLSSRKSLFLSSLVLLGLSLTSCKDKATESGIVGTAPSAKAAGSSRDFILSTLDGGSFETGRLRADSATLIWILSPECPLCHDYAYTFRAIEDSFQQKGIRVIGVFPGEFFSEQQIRMYCSRYLFDFPVLLDPDYRFIHQLSATTTPEVVLLNPEGRTLYQGAIDNWAYEVGRKRLEPTEHYLRNALEAYLAGQPVPLAQTKAVGCLIE